MSVPCPPEPYANDADLGDRLDSWKEIAVYLNRGVRTVIRWEAEEGLPVHRQVHQKRAFVHAFKRELDAWIQRRTLRPQPAAGSLPQAGADETERTPSAKRQWLLAALACAATIAAVGWAIAARGASRPASVTVPLTSYPGTEVYPNFSPDGTRVAFSWDGGKPYAFDLFEIVLGSEAKPLRLTNRPARHLYSAWSPDGLRIALIRSTGGDEYEVAWIPALGGPERHVANVLANARSPHVRWTPDGNWIVAPSHVRSGGPEGLSLYPRDGGESRPLRTSIATQNAEAASFSPNGRWLEPAGGGEESSLIPSINNVRNFAVVKDGIYYEESRSPRDFKIRFYSFSDRRSHSIAAIEKTSFEGLAAAPGGDWFLLSTLEEHPGNLWLTENFR